ncbi:MAG: XRE family transcriptional regulator [Bacteroidetes bacterium]|nr:MAG: XRE family transcriptional regulator [Bacteroidota bacterium]
MERSEKELFLRQLGEHISSTRKMRGVSSAELARKTYSDTSLISRIEKGRTNPTITTLKMICDALEISFEDLFHGFRYH